jgi:hypothetical protein
MPFSRKMEAGLSAKRVRNAASWRNRAMKVAMVSVCDRGTIAVRDSCALVETAAPCSAAKNPTTSLNSTRKDAGMIPAPEEVDTGVASYATPALPQRLR